LKNLLGWLGKKFLKEFELSGRVKGVGLVNNLGSNPGGDKVRPKGVVI
jgi:hypothetical protein